MFDRFSSSGDFNRLVSNRRSDIHRSIWRFNSMRVFDYIIDQIRIRKERQITGVLQGLLFLLAKFTCNLMKNTYDYLDFRRKIK